MTTTKEAAGLVERLEQEAALNRRAYPERAHVASEAAQEIRTLLAQVEELRRERDEARAAHGKRADMRAEAAEARATKAEAGIAEAVKAEAAMIMEDPNWAPHIRHGAKMLRDAVLKRLNQEPRP